MTSQTEFQSFDTVVAADYGQFMLRTSVKTSEAPEYEKSPLAFVIDPGDLAFIVPWHDEEVLIEVRLFVTRPAPLDDSWKDVSELSIRAGAMTSIGGWEATESDVRIPLVENETYRVRYALADWDRMYDHWDEKQPDEQTAKKGDIVIDLWPKELEAARLVVQKSDGGRWEAIHNSLEFLKREIEIRQPRASETERVTEFADRAFAAHPFFVEMVLNGEGQSLLRNAELLKDWSGMPPDQSDMQLWENASRERIEAIVIHRAKVAAQR